MLEIWYYKIARKNIIFGIASYFMHWEFFNLTIRRVFFLPKPRINHFFFDPVKFLHNSNRVIRSEEESFSYLSVFFINFQSAMYRNFTLYIFLTGTSGLLFDCYVVIEYLCSFYERCYVFNHHREFIIDVVAGRLINEVHNLL